MKLIDSVEIGYFRSIYKQRLDRLDGVTVLFGRNDSGKSNVLRALNLFFNDQTNPGQSFSFERDLSHARNREAPFEIVSGAGTTKMESLAHDGPVLTRLAPGRKLYVLVDNDKEGRELYKNGRLAPGGRWVKHNSNGTYWCRLPWMAEFRAAMQGLRIPDNAWPGTLENLFPTAVRAVATLDGAYAVESIPYSELLTPELLPRILPAVIDPAHVARYYVLAPSADCKELFADWIVQRAQDDAAVLEPLRTVIEGLIAIVEPGPH